MCKRCAPLPAVLGCLSLGLAAFTVAAPKAPEAETMDRDLIEVTVPALERFYSEHKYTVTQVVQWHLARIRRYDGIYRAVEQVLERQALEAAAREDAAAARGGARGPLWGVPIVIKANTSIEGQVTTDGWDGYTIPGHELVAPRDATVVSKLRAAGAILIGHTNMPDFANSDTNRSSSFGRTGNAYDVRFSPGGSSGGTVTAVTSNMAVLGSGTDTGNSIRMPSATSGVVGIFPTRGLVSTAGIAPLDWLLDNTGPIARNVTDAAIALSVMAGPDPLDPPTGESSERAQPGPYARYLKADALKGKRFGVPAFILDGVGPPFHGVPAVVPDVLAAKQAADQTNALDPATRIAFLKAVEELRGAGAIVMMDDSILPDRFANIASRVATYPYVKEGTDRFLKTFGPAQYHSASEYDTVVGQPLGQPIIGTETLNSQFGDVTITQRAIETDPEAEANFFGPRKRLMDLYLETMDRLHLDGYVYPAIQMPPIDETLPQNGRVSEGPHSDTSWVNMLGVPAIVVVGGIYPSGLPFGLEISTRPWLDGDLIGYAYAYEQATHHRRRPVLVEQGLLTKAP
ncbi:MAG TPA: amidase [Steroidobacteraceae bacterium]|jgi:Asp-tRNA(Asn)/Glu-tRNA(Gln) amidotransferase A subunit family amidase|nr:amidase [Steroidobacteraceae bacterium]